MNQPLPSSCKFCGKWFKPSPRTSGQFCGQRCQREHYKNRHRKSDSPFWTEDDYMRLAKAMLDLSAEE